MEKIETPSTKIDSNKNATEDDKIDGNQKIAPQNKIPIKNFSTSGQKVNKEDEDETERPLNPNSGDMKDTKTIEKVTPQHLIATEALKNECLIWKWESICRYFHTSQEKHILET